MEKTKLDGFWICYKEESPFSGTWIDGYIYSDVAQATDRMDELVKKNPKEKDFFYMRLVTLR